MNQPPTLQQAAEHLQAGRTAAARTLLAGYVRRRPDDIAAWLMLSQAVESAQQQADCLRQVLRLDPRHPAAQHLLAQMHAPPSQTNASPTQAAPRPAAPPQSPNKSAPAEESASSSPWYSGPPQPGAFDASTEPQPTYQADAQAASPGDLPLSAWQTASPPEPIGEFARPPASPTVDTPRRATPRPPQRRSTRLRLGLLALLGIALICLAAVGLGLLFLPQLLPPQVSELVNQVILPPSTAVGLVHTPTPTSKPGEQAPQPFILPPTWTITPTPTTSPTRTPLPTPSPMPSPTLMAPAPTTLAFMDRIQQEVSELRGLPALSNPPRYLVSRYIIEQQLRAELGSGDGIQKLEDLGRYLSALTLIGPNYDMARYAMNGLLDNIGGFYRPDTKEIFVLELRFGGMEHVIYAHEFDHALVDQHFDLNALNREALCNIDSDRCMAQRAVIEGDATLLMYEWLKQYAPKQDYADILNYRPPFQALPDEAPPDFVVQELDFPYNQGMEFVKRFYEQDGWKGVDELYAALPTSTEQILHPEKYLAGELPIPILDPDIQLAFRAPWRGIANDTLGELTTYLILAYSADTPARRSQAEAEKAAAGWGGDRVQVLYNDKTDQTILGVHWVWDSPQDAEEFQAAAEGFFDQHRRGGRLAEQPNCWQSEEQLTCLYRRDTHLLLITAPDAVHLELAKQAYSWE